ncbi:hypothetical protein IC617_05055 [Neiella sp. HB171785]|uniref:Lipoprotein n=1 Tax=Neiella litorisoli TaxID=2771431 RepID=A0A8J6UIP7_9GAMM|nr:hypothetical protein [Neiella litorisoli]MBD1388788.1 hypothetical protein [Neiella litorisoli]
MAKIIKGFVAGLAVGWSNACLAGCGEGTEQCLVISELGERWLSCQIRICANANEYSSDWQLVDGSSVSLYRGASEQRLLVDGKHGLELPNAILKDDLSCFGTATLDRVYCTKAISY